MKKQNTNQRTNKPTLLVISDDLPTNPETLERFQGTANALLESGHENEAIALLESLVQVVPNNPDLINSLGSALSSLGRYDEAVECAKQLTRLEPALSANWVQLGFAYLNCRRSSKAKQALDKAMAIKSSDSFEIKNKVGLAISLKYRLEDAERMTRELVRMAPETQSNLFVLGFILELRGNQSEAGKVYVQTVKLDPGSVVGQAAASKLMTFATGQN